MITNPNPIFRFYLKINPIFNMIIGAIIGFLCYSVSFWFYFSIIIWGFISIERFGLLYLGIKNNNPYSLPIYDNIIILYLNIGFSTVFIAVLFLKTLWTYVIFVPLVMIIILLYLIYKMDEHLNRIEFVVMKYKDKIYKITAQTVEEIEHL